jgi:redox-sensitive bicupin YhaK (pirin superfamily)
MYSKGVEIYEIMIENGSYALPLNTSKMRSFYMLEGNLLANKNALEQHDFVRFKNEEKLQLSTKTKARIFVIDLLKDPGYTTYAQHNRLS